VASWHERRLTSKGKEQSMRPLADDVVVDPHAARRRRKGLWAVFVSAVAGLVGGAAVTPASAADTVTFDMVRSAAATKANCLIGARASVSVHSLGPVEEMTVVTQKLPPNTEFDFFVIQVPDAPFGLAWYQGDIETDENGVGVGTFIGRFSIETFIVAPRTPGAPVVHDQGPFPDADSNPATDPVHTFHLGLWFNSPEDAAKAGCPDTVTPFNGDHTAGIQALSTRQNAPDKGPLRFVGD
jgi:hypothetical protein